MISEYGQEQQQLSQIYNEETEKPDFREIIDSLDELYGMTFTSDADRQMSQVDDEGVPIVDEDFQYIEHRIFTDYHMGPEMDVRDTDHERIRNDKGWNPYEQDLTNYPEIYKMYGENFDRYERAKKHFEDDDAFAQPAHKGPHEFRVPKNQDPWTKKYDDFMPRYDGSSHV